MPAAAAQPRILIADDDPQGMELLEAYLSGAYELATAADGDQALRKVQEFNPDLILLDVMMPKMSGFEVCKRVRSDPKTRHIAVIMVTALDQPSDWERALEAGTEEFLTKPINKAELLLRIQAALKARHSATELERTLSYIAEVEKGAQTARPSS